jgi:hypothetical protein
VTAAHLGDHERGRGLRQIHHGVGLRIGEVHIVAAREVRHLRRRGRVVALAAAVLRADVVPEIDLEGLDVGGGRRGTGIGVTVLLVGADAAVAAVGRRRRRRRSRQRSRQREQAEYA